MAKEHLKTLENYEGVCPHCNSQDISFEDFSYEGDYEVKYFVCNSCGRKFQETFFVIRQYDYTEYKELSLDDKTLFDKP